MGMPGVYIEREPLLNMVLAAVEVYNRECLRLWIQTEFQTRLVHDLEHDQLGRGRPPN
jgi:hypothetical protein